MHIQTDTYSRLYVHMQLNILMHAIYMNEDMNRVTKPHSIFMLNGQVDLLEILLFTRIHLRNLDFNIVNPIKLQFAGTYHAFF